MSTKKDLETVAEDRDKMLDQHIGKLQNLKEEGSDLANPIELQTSFRRGDVGVRVTTVVAIMEVSGGPAKLPY